MPIMFADYDPGTLTGFYIACLGCLAVGSCVIAAIALLFSGSKKAAGQCLKVAGACVVATIVVVVLEIGVAKSTGLP